MILGLRRGTNLEPNDIANAISIYLFDTYSLQTDNLYSISFNLGSSTNNGLLFLSTVFVYARRHFRT